VKKERIQIFEGIIIAKKHGKGISGTMTVRKVVDGVGVERVFSDPFPLNRQDRSCKAWKSKKGKLYYLRTAKGKKAKLKRKDFAAAIADKPDEAQTVEEAPVETPKTEDTPNT